jgi:hypothetical protein
VRGGPDVEGVGGVSLAAGFEELDGGREGSGAVVALVASGVLAVVEIRGGERV